MSLGLALWEFHENNANFGPLKIYIKKTKMKFEKMLLAIVDNMLGYICAKFLDNTTSSLGAFDQYVPKNHVLRKGGKTQK